ncbi:hypothetical protein SAMN04488579_11065 [Eubacterium barkeri]|uniref:Uncharacterized protein n=1 Tax=Eubacterium barkeri TaxID=1528 RepID=A0A1H3FGQ4_EUBBA|nr:hypothetical protein SAMN04488579_11065 [Eubacterium barkeri]
MPLRKREGAVYDEMESESLLDDIGNHSLLRWRFWMAVIAVRNAPSRNGVPGSTPFFNVL